MRSKIKKNSGGVCVFGEGLIHLFSYSKGESGLDMQAVPHEHEQKQSGGTGIF